MSRIAIFDGDDWSVMFVDGEIADQAHSFGIDDIAKYAPIDRIQVQQTPFKADQWMAERGEAPWDITIEDFMRLGTD
jgi:hypothetical protein